MSEGHKPFVYTVRVGYADTDKMGFAHHSRFLVYLESTRTELLRSAGDSYRAWEQRGVLLPVVRANLEFTKPAFYDDVLSVEVEIADLSRLRLQFKYRVGCIERGVHIARGETHHVFMNENGKPIRVDDSFLEKLKPFVA